MANAPTNPNHPLPPEYLDGEALLEWFRILNEMERAGLTITPACRSPLISYVQAWQTAQNAFVYVEKWGSVVRWPNKSPGYNPFFKAWMDSAKLCNTMLLSLGLVPLKGSASSVEVEEEEL